MKIGILTSGGDGPGMNSCIRSLVRVGINKGLEIIGIYKGYFGILTEHFEKLHLRSVANIIQRGGTILKTGRCPEFKTKSGVLKAADILKKHKFDGLIAIGGDGTMRGLKELSEVWNGQIIGIPGTIDNDIYGTDFTIGYDTAVNTALNAIDKIRDTADAFERFFLIEVMGRDAGFIALDVGIAGGAEEIMVPETPTNLEETCTLLRKNKEKGKKSNIIIVAEGDDAGDAMEISRKIKDELGDQYRVSVLGYIQRGGSPTARDRILATRLGAYAIDAIVNKENGFMVGEINQKVSKVPFEDTWKKKKEIDYWMLDLAKILAT